MTDLEKYKFLLGEIVMLYQIIENDLKIITAAMLQGDYKKNIDLINKEVTGLGEAVRELEKLDNCDGKPFFNKAKYDFLKQIARERNFYCHACCLDFAYKNDIEHSHEFRIGYKKLIATREDLIAVQNSTEEFRILVLKRYRGL